MVLYRLATDEAIDKRKMDKILLQRDMNHSQVVFTEILRCLLYVPPANLVRFSELEIKNIPHKQKAA